MNSHQRRVRERAARSNDSSPTVPAPTVPQKAERQSIKRPLYKRLRTGYRRSRKVLLIAATVLLPSYIGYQQLKPSLLVEPYGTQNPRFPLTEQFSIENDSLYDITDLSPYCGLLGVARPGFVIADIDLVRELEKVPVLSPKVKTTTTCSLDGFQFPFNITNTNYPLWITIGAKFKVPLGFPACREFRFLGKPRPDKTYIWTYDSAIRCGAEVKTMK